MNRQEAISEFRRLKPEYEAAGCIIPGAKMFIPDEWQSGNLSLDEIAMGMDAAGTLSTDPNSALPTILTTAVDPDVYRVVFAPLQIAEIVGGERKVGDWLEEQRIFPVVEDTGEVTSYGDYANGGRAGVNFNYPWLQSYLYQTFIRYGERETARAGLMKINYVGDLTKSAAGLLNRAANNYYAFGISGLQNYGLLNNPFLSASLTPATKAAGGTGWFNGNSPNATANEVYNDILAMVEKLQTQTNGTVDLEQPLTLALSPFSSVALRFANSFGVYVKDLLKEGFPNLKVKTAIQYGQITSTNNQGYSSAGNLVQLIADEIEGQKTAYCAFNEKLRAHKLIPEPSAWSQKYTSGVWGTVFRLPVASVTMLGI